MSSQSRPPFFNGDFGLALLFWFLALALLSASIWGVDGHFSFGIVLLILLFCFLGFCCFMSGLENLKKARALYEQQNPELSKRQHEKTRKILKITILSAIVCALAITIVTTCVHKNKTEEAIELYKADIMSVCEKWQMYSPEITVSKSIYSNNSYDFDVSGSVGGSHEKEKYENTYQLIKELGKIEESYSKAYLYASVIVDGTRYSIIGKDLYAEHHPVYTHLTEYDKSFLSKLSKDVPYVGLSDDYINDTSLGHYDDIEFCKDYFLLQPDHQHKEYIWYEGGNEIFSAHVLGGEVITTYDRRSGKLITKDRGNS